MISEIWAKRYCCEDISKIENFEQANADTTQTWQCHHRLEVQGDKLISKRKLIVLNLYYQRPASELIFVTPSMHKTIHGAYCAKGAEAANAKMTAEQKTARSRKGGKRGGPAALATWTFEQRSKINKGKKWWNNGTVNKLAKECPGDGWLRGQMRRRST